VSGQLAQVRGRPERRCEIRPQEHGGNLRNGGVRICCAATGCGRSRARQYAARTLGAARPMSSIRRRRRGSGCDNRIQPKARRRSLGQTQNHPLDLTLERRRHAARDRFGGAGDGQVPAAVDHGRFGWRYRRPTLGATDRERAKEEGNRHLNTPSATDALWRPCAPAGLNAAYGIQSSLSALQTFVTADSKPGRDRLPGPPAAWEYLAPPRVAELPPDGA
jgi:hypothetical protein